MKAGTISLFNADGRLLGVRNYISIPDRQRTMAVWNRLYIKKHTDCFIQIFPQTGNYITDCGENGRKPYQRHRP